MDNNLEAILESLRPLLARVRTDVSALKKPGKGQFWTSDPLTDERMLKHLNGVQELRGVCPIKEGSSTTQVALLDMDSHKGEVPWDDMLSRAKGVRQALIAQGLKPLMFRSSGGHGVHLIMVWDQPQDAQAVRRKLRGILLDIDYVDMAGGRGILDNRIEVFPKQDAVPMGGMGNQFILPLGAQSRYIDPAQGLIEDNGAAAKMLVWEASQDIAPVTEGDEPLGDGLEGKGATQQTFDMDFEQAVAQQPLDLTEQEIIDYLKAYPASECDYHQWMIVGAALHHQYQGSDHGLKIFNAWSAKDKENYNKSEIAKKWKSFGKYTGKPVTMATIIKKVGGVSKVQVTLDDGTVTTKFGELKTKALAVTDLNSYQAISGEIAGMSRTELGDDLRSLLAKSLHTAWAKGEGLNLSDVRKALSNKAVAKVSGTGGRPKYDLDEDGRIKCSSYNNELLASSPNESGMEIGYDGFQDCIMFRRNEKDGWQRFSDQHYQELMVKAERLGFHYSDKMRVRDAVYSVAMRNSFDSAQIWLKSLVWDGVQRVETFFTDYFGVEPSHYANAVSRYLWTAAAGRVLVPGIQADMTPVLVGEQGLRKTTGIKAMSPSPEFFSELSFGEKEDELARKMRGSLICEIAELRGLRSKEKEHIKAWLTRTHEKWVPKYKEFTTSFPRRCVFIGSTNDPSFLDEDSSGQRRWLPLEVGRADVDGIVRDCHQLWAEAKDLFGVLEVDHQEAEQLAREVHGDFVQDDPIESLVYDWLDRYESLDGVDKVVTTGEVLKGALGIDPASGNHHGMMIRASIFIRKHGWRKTMRRINKHRVKVWVKSVL